MIRRRLKTLEKSFRKPGTCPTCGKDAADITFIEVLSCDQSEPPLGYWYEKPCADSRPGERFPYPPDPRPVCPKCGQPIGPMLFLTAVYDEAEWDALQEGMPVDG